MNERIYELVTERMIAALERGTIPWRKPWHAHTGHRLSGNPRHPREGRRLTTSARGMSH